MELAIGLVWCMSPILGYVIATQKQDGFLGALFGLFLGPIGVIAAGFLDSRPMCPMCHTRLNQRPQICPACKTMFKWKGGECTYFQPNEQK